MEQPKEFLPLVGLDEPPYQVSDVEIVWPIVMQTSPNVVDDPRMASVGNPINFTIYLPIRPLICDWPDVGCPVLYSFVALVDHSIRGPLDRNIGHSIFDLVDFGVVSNRIPLGGQSRQRHGRHHRHCQRRHRQSHPSSHARLLSLCEETPRTVKIPRFCADSREPQLYKSAQKDPPWHPGVVRRVSVDERRARLVARHGLGQSFDNVVEAAGAMVGLHSSDPATVFLSCRARVADFKPTDLEEALYEEKTLLRILGMRRTMWVVPTGLARYVQASSTSALIEPQRRRLIRMFEDGGVAEDGEAWLTSVATKTMEALDRLGEATARELSEAVPQLSARITARKSDGSLIGEFGASTRVLFQLATEGRVVRGRPMGTWLSSQYRWSTMENWVSAGFEEVDRASAESEILLRWLRSFGPGTETDLKWWTGWPVTRVRKTLDRIGAVEVEMETEVGYLLPDDEEAPEPGLMCVSLLPSLDPTTMGWKRREWYLGDLGNRLFDRNGNAGPTIWADGRVVGGWTQRPDGEVVYGILEDVGRETVNLVDEEVHDLTTWLGDVNVTARFRTPLDKELADN